MSVEPLEPADYRDAVRRALAEDLGWGDLTSQAIQAGEAPGVGRVIAGAAGVLAGIDVAIETFRQMAPAMSVTRRGQDGDGCAVGDVVLELRGEAAALLTAERTALNFLGHLSGIATLTRRFVDAAGGRVRIADTRKTAPLLRVLDKYAVRAGGGENGRLALDDGLIVKRNHAVVAGGLAEAVRRARQARPDIGIEAEVASPAEADDAIDAGAVVLLVSATAPGVVAAIAARAAGRARLEASGVSRPEDVQAMAAAGADVVAVPLLTTAAPWLDVTFELRPA